MPEGWYALGVLVTLLAAFAVLIAVALVIVRLAVLWIVRMARHA